MTGYFVRRFHSNEEKPVAIFPPEFELWSITDQTASAVWPEFRTIEAQRGENIWDTISKNGFHKENFLSLEITPGFYYPRIWRPTLYQETYGSLTLYKIQRDAITQAQGQLTILCRYLDQICRTVHPSKNTLGSYGNEIRNLLILACTEIEAHWQGILLINGVNKSRPTTQDFIALNAPLKLQKYSFLLKNYPWLGPFRPFANWNADQGSTKSIPWYDAYNKTKHNREQNFETGNLEAAINSVVACGIMLVAQYGWGNAFGPSVDLSNYFLQEEIPDWELSEHYVPYFGDHHSSWQTINFQWPNNKGFTRTTKSLMHYRGSIQRKRNSLSRLD